MEAMVRTQEGKREKDKLVTVTLITVDEQTGEQVSEEKLIPKGKTKVPDLKQELGVAAELSLWVIDRSGRRRRLADHETHSVKEGDRFEVIRPGGVS